MQHLGFDTSEMHMSFADGNYTREAILEGSISSARRQHADIERLVYVGDAVWDVKTCRNMAIPFVGIRRAGDVEVLHREGAAHVLTDYLDYRKFMDYVEKADSP